MSAFVPAFEAIQSVVVEQFDGSALRAFKDCHRGRRCFIIGNGPSLQRTDLAPLADEITIGVNGIFYMTWQCGFAPTYYVVEDNHVFADNLDRIGTVDAVARFFPSKYRPIIEPTADTQFLPTDWSFYWGSSEWFEIPRFSHDVSKVIYAGQTVTFMNIQLATYMGCNEIYLIGVDFDYKIPAEAQIDGLTITSVDDDPNHFHPEYFGKGKRWHLPKLDNVENAMRCAKEGVERAGGRILNATVGGKLEVFPRADYHDVVNRQVVADPNHPTHYLLTRALERGALWGLKSVAIDGELEGPDVEAIVAASPLQFADPADADIAVTDRLPTTDRAAELGRVFVVAGDPTAGDSQATADWLARVIVERLADGRSAFWTRSVLELSPDGESLMIPTLGRRAQLAVDPRRHYGIDDLDKLGESRETRWTNGLALTIDQVSALANDIAHHHHSFGVVDGYIYVQSRWKPTELPTNVLEGEHP
jgi:6-hydroxymethylpterin diphosphokinase MptE-like protein